MSSHGKLRRTNRRAIAFGVGLSVAAHAAVFAFLSMDVPALEQRKPVTITFAESPYAEEDPVMEVVELRLNEAASLSLEAASAGGGAEDPGASRSNAPVPAAAHALQPTVSSADLAYDQLVVVEPARSLVVTPVAFDELAVAETAAPATSEADEVAVYVPGSIGRAKKGWAAVGDGDGSGSNGLRSGWTLVDGRGDGHCPVVPPGRGLPPTILR